MKKIFSALGVIANIASFVFLYFSLFPPHSGADNALMNPAFAFWAYSVLTAILAIVLYTIGNFPFSAYGNGEIGRFVFTLAMFALCIFIGGALNTFSIILWNIIFAINLIVQIRWIAT